MEKLFLFVTGEKRGGGVWKISYFNKVCISGTTFRKPGKKNLN
jgi:hypothetical protein